ncbi:hypothetical protein D0267_08240 [Vibrio alginolyticus]|nr:hypothetical protein [Vibrio alginolyticus]
MMKRDVLHISNRVIVQLVKEFGVDALNDERMFPVIYARMAELSGEGRFTHKLNGGNDATKITDV